MVKMRYIEHWDKTVQELDAKTLNMPIEDIQIARELIKRRAYEYIRVADSLEEAFALALAEYDAYIQRYLLLHKRS